MAKAFDAATKHLIDDHPADWLAYAGLPLATKLRVIDSDLSSITTAADKLILVEKPEPYIAHLELQSGADSTLDRRMLAYDAIARLRHGLPVRSVLFLLRPQAAGGVTGGVHDTSDAESRIDYRYRVIRVWEQPPETALAGGLGTLPLALIGRSTESQLAPIVDIISARLQRETSPADASELWAAAAILLGLRYSRQVINRLLKGVRAMEESVVYQDLIERGRLEEARATIVRLGHRFFGAPDERALATIRQIENLQRLEAMQSRVFEVSSWDELLS